MAALLAEAGYEPRVLESEPGRASTVVRIAGRDPAAPALLVHGHLDVVPAAASDWSFDPFGGEVRDGHVWGRGALDMKDFVAQMLAVALGLADAGQQPERDLVLAFVADEEDTGRYGAGFLVESHRDLFTGVTTAIGEGGGGLTRLPDGQHVYPISTGERGSAWLELTARGPAGHGSALKPDNAVATLVRTVAALADIDWPVVTIPTVRALLDVLGTHLGAPIDPRDRAALDRLGEARSLVDRTLSSTLNPTMLSAGYKVNVIPSEATAHLDGRVLPGLEDDFFAAVDALLPAGVTRRFDSWAAPFASPHDSPDFAGMTAALLAHDSGALVVPYVAGGGTDAKWFSTIGIECYGFGPSRTAADFPGHRYVHGVDERVPLDSLHFGVHVLDTFLRAAPGAHVTAAGRQAEEHR